MYTWLIDCEKNTMNIFIIEIVKSDTKNEFFLPNLSNIGAIIMDPNANPVNKR